MPEPKRAILFIGIVLVIAACGGSTTATPPAGGAASGSGLPAASAEGGPGRGSDAVPTGPAATAGGSAPTTGGAGTGVCDLVTVAELESIFGVTAVTTTVVAGPPDTCDIQQDSAPLSAFVLTPSGGAMVFDLLAAGPDAQKVDGIGDAAFYSPSTLLLAIKSGDAMLSIAVLDEGRSEAVRLGLMKQLGTIAAGRM